MNQQPQHASQAIAKHLREFYFGGNWNGVSLKENLTDVTWQQATKQVASFHTIAVLVFHINYYVTATMKFLNGGELVAIDELSFDCPPIESQEDWENLLAKTWDEAEAFAAMIEQLSESRLWENMIDGKNGDYYRNLAGIIEHGHYHAGQIAMIKKLVA